MPNIRPYDTGNLALRPTETGVEAAAGAARRVGAFYNQRAGATDELARNTQQLGHETGQLGRETGDLGNFEGGLIKDVGNRAGSALQAAGDQYVAYEDHKEISHGAAVASDMFVNLEKQWNDQLKGADPNDPSVAAKFNETVLKPSLEQFGENFTTERSQQFAEGIVDRYRQHFATKTAADMSTLGGIAAKENAQKTVNSLSSAVYLDPTSLDTAIDTLKHSAGHIVDSSPTIDAETGARVKSELSFNGVSSLVKAAGAGYVAKNPNFDLDAFQKKYADYISGGEIKMFQKAAQTQAHADAWTQKQLETAQRKEIETKAAGELSKNWTDNVTYDETGQVHVKPQAMQNILDIERKYPGAATADSQKMISFLQAQQREKREVIISDQATRGDLLQRMSSPDKFPTEIEILRAQAEHKLSPQDGKEMLELQKAITQRPGGEALKRDHAEFFKQYGPTIDPEMKLGNPTPLGAQGMYRAEMDAYRQEEALRQKGLDPHLVYDPRSEYFFGNPKNISGYRPTLQDQTNYKAQQKSDQQRKGTNLTGDGNTITGISTTPAPVATSVPRPPAPKPPEKGFVKDGYEFLGGSPGDAANWRKVK
jgi:hypothetical protein